MLAENREEWSRDWRRARKLLCVRLDTMGDVLMTTPALRALKHSFPGVHLTLLTSDPGSRIAPLVPEIDAVETYAAPWMKATPAGHDPAEDHQQIERLARAGYDGAVIFTVFSQNPQPAALLLYLAGIPLRLAYSRENPYHLLTHWAPEVDHPHAMRHEVQRHLDLVAAIGAGAPDQRLSLSVPPGAFQAVTQRMQRLGLRLDQPWVVIHPGATAPSRRYPPRHFARLADCLGQHGIQVVLTGSASERELTHAIQAQTHVATWSLAGALPLDELAALLALTPLLISNNTGPVHMAAALGTPVVDIYALTNPQHTPWMTPNRVLNHDVPCKFCYKSECPLGHHHCLELLDPERVYDAALELLEAPIKQNDG